MRDITEQVIDPFFFACGRFRIRVLEDNVGTRYVWLTDDGNHIASFHGETFDESRLNAQRVLVALLKTEVAAGC